MMMLDDDDDDDDDDVDDDDVDTDDDDVIIIYGKHGKGRLRVRVAFLSLQDKEKIDHKRQQIAETYGVA